MTPSDRRYSFHHVWVKLSGDIAELGLTSHFFRDCSGVLFSDLPERDKVLSIGHSVCSVTCTNHLDERPLICPISGQVYELGYVVYNEFPMSLRDSDPYGSYRTVLRLRGVDRAEYDLLLTAEEYDVFADLGL